jgi:hypothetical protein
MRNSPLSYIWENGKLIGVSLASTDATQTPPNKLEEELVRIFHEWGELEAENAKLKEALQSLYDEQNGPPLIRHKESWQAAMDEAGALLRE